MNKQKSNLYIFEKSINKDNRLIPLKTRNNYLGEIKYLPPVAKEWKNTIYAFNQNFTKNLPVTYNHVNHVIQHYFGLRFFPKFINKNYKPRWVRRHSMNKIYVSNAEIKHTNNKSILTIYTYNREKASLLKKIQLLKKGLLNKIKFLIVNNKQNLGKFAYKIIQNLLKKELRIIRKFKLRLNLNKYKFEEKLLYKLSNIIGIYFNKKIEFNIVNMKSIVYNTDIFTRILSDKLSKKRILPVKMMKYILYKAVLPKVNRISEKTPSIKSIDFNLIENKYRNPHLMFALQNNNFNSLLKELYINTDNLNSSSNYDEIHNIIFNLIKYKNMAGIKLEAKGRLTKRNRADRSVVKVRWKGGLKNVYSSFKGLSTMKMRGHINSNVEYSILASKRRVGAFAVKGWVSGK